MFRKTVDTWTWALRGASLLALSVALGGCGETDRAVVADDTSAGDTLPSARADIPTEDAHSDAAGSEAGDTDAEVDGATEDAGPATTGTLHGVVKSESGKALVGTAILCCSKLNCLYGTSGFGGKFTIKHVPPGDRLVKVTEQDEVVPRLAEAVAPVRVVVGEDLDVGTLYVPTLPAGADLATEPDEPVSVDVGDGLVLTLRRSALKAPLGTTSANIAARRVPPDQVPPTVVVPGHALVAVYALYPFGVVSSEPIGVSLPVAGTRATVLSPSQHLSIIHEVDAVLSPAGDAVWDGATISGGSITRLTWLVVSQPIDP